MTPSLLGVGLALALTRMVAPATTDEPPEADRPVPTPKPSCDLPLKTARPSRETIITGAMSLRPQPPTVYLRLEAGLGAATNSSSSSFGRAHEPAVAGLVRLNARLWRDLWLGAFAELTGWRDPPLAVGPGYDWNQWDVGLAPRYSLHPFTFRGRTVGFEAYLAVPFGLTSVHPTVPPRRAFREELRQTSGWFTGVTAGAAYSGWSRIMGVFVEIGYAHHMIGLTSTVTPPGEASSVEHADISDHRVMVSVGGMLTLAKSGATMPPRPSEPFEEPGPGAAADPAEQGLRRTTMMASRGK